MKLVTVIIPVYNGEKQISNIIQSVLKQSYSYFELLIVNDGSTDNTQKICEEYAKNDRRVRVLNKNNGGVSETRNYGLENCCGDLICFADADDKVESKWIETMIATMKAEKDDLIICGYEKYNEVLEENHKISRGGEWNRDTALDVCLGDLGGFLWNKIFKKEIIEKYKIRFHTDIYECEDLLFVCEYLMHCRTIISIPQILYRYDVSEGNKRTMEKQKSRLTAIECMIQILKRNNCSQKNIKKLVAEYIVRGNKHNITFSREQMNFTFAEGLMDLLLSQNYTMKERIYHIYFFVKNYKK